MSLGGEQNSEIRRIADPTEDASGRFDEGNAIVAFEPFEWREGNSGATSSTGALE